METEKNLENSLISTITKSSSWPIIRGSLDDAITCESSFSAVDSDSDHAVHISRKPHLIMRRPSPDSDPCEITIFFTQQHEIKQIYVRSTARVYEIYYAADKMGDNQYLCTVRCGVAARMEELMQETDGVESLSSSINSSNRSSCEGHLKTDSGGSANEDGWVDVEVQDGCLEKKDESCMERGNQDCFEATAEISDADPVQSVTLRLLSIQSGDFIHIDELYVFADPVEFTDTNSPTNAKDSSSESATMSLLIPTLLNLSKLRRNEKQEQSDSAVGGRKHQDIEHKSNGPFMGSNTSQSERIQGTATMLNGASVPMSQPDLPVQRLDSHNISYLSSERNDLSCSRIEKTLDELVSRVSKIEQFCVRFEENLLKPVSNMEARLERVEQQLDSFVNNAKTSMTACTRFSAPDFSCVESDSNSILTGRNDSPNNTNSKSMKKDETHFQEFSVSTLEANSPLSVPSIDVPVSMLDANSSVSVPPIDVPVSTLDANSSVSVPPNNVPSSSVSQLTPGLVVTAPDFSYIDDEGEMDTFEASKESPISSRKKPISVDDALASALAGFLSSASIDTDVVEKTADNFCKEENGITCPSELIQSDECVVPSDHIIGDHKSVEGIVVTEQETFGAGNDHEDAADSVDEYNLLSTEGDLEKSLGHSDSNVANLDEGDRYISDLSVDDCSRTAIHGSSQTSVFGSSESSANDLAVSVSGVDSENFDSSAGEETSKECSSLLLDILRLQKPAALDFGIPILDVKFLSEETFSAKSSFDTLLPHNPKLHGAASSVEEDNALSYSEKNDLVAIEDVGSTTSETSYNQFCFDNYDDFSCMPSKSSNRDKDLPEPCECSIQNLDASLI